jgi:hypothetical protein
MKKLVFIIPAFFLIASTPVSEEVALQTPVLRKVEPGPNVPFQVGEKLTYKVRYGWIEAGKAELEVRPSNMSFEGEPLLHMYGTGSSEGTFDWFYKVRDVYETHIDQKAFRPHKFVRKIHEGSFHMERELIFDQKEQVVHTDKKGEMKMPEDVQDMLSSFYFLRTIDMSRAKPGDIYLVNAFLDYKLYPFKVKYLGEETIKVKKGKYACYKFVPVVQKGRIFKDEEDLLVWVSADENKIPILAKANVLVGSIKMEIDSYRGLVGPVAKR